ncbi:RagB/SusD family nutrient uptake outer membrane protein [Mangrovimonas sp. TPBH4]|uniref:RagB/SusD family nutrient uptake outer membrane protein n=1 Tax=Mangrovimonas sp. TPBH4 TaxID=1645914 RepID=UPI0006B48275|nr:RagB/SusD family nutrient uptake outer membrane protein [Mangrovimonas sp. TPBH4]
MNTYTNRLFKTKLVAVLTVVLGLSSCTGDFLDRPPEDSYNVDEFYQTTEQVNAATNALYTRPWYNFVTNVSWCIGEISSGNGRTWDPRNGDFMNFAITGEHGTLTQAWESLYAVVAQSNAVINTLPEKVAADVPVDVVNNALGEARVIRAAAYFYLVRIFGSIPIIADNNEYVLEPVVPRNPESDVYEFIKRDLEFAIDNCYEKVRGSNYDANAKVSSGSAKALLAKVYLYEQNYTMAYQLASEVINSGEFKLYGGDAEDGDPTGSYYDLFLTINDNNPESIIALQWTNTGVWAEGNGLQSLFAPAGVTGFSDGWSAVGPSIDLQQAYEDTELDERYYATIMAPGAYYPDLNDGYTVSENISHQGTNTGVKKYVVGNAATNGGGAAQSYPNNTYILRYGELLLIHAEAALSGGGSTADGIASFNKVRRRAGLEDKPNPTLDDVFHERRIELAYESEFWYDVVRRGPDFALNFLSNTERGTYNNDTDPPSVWSETYTATMDDLLFPYPNNEIENNPALLEPPVPYDFE